jgi:hypothetical protein
MTSTKLSCDLILSRPSTRLHAPPGGKTSISLFGGGQDEPTVVKRAPAPRAMEPLAEVVSSASFISFGIIVML